MERDTGRDRGGDHAAWRDLVARLELPSPVDPAEAPWPDRENLGPAKTPPHGPGDSRAATSGPAGLPESLRGPGSPARPAKPASPGPPDTPFSHGRVIRPATFTRSTGPGEDRPPRGAELPPRWHVDPLRGSGRGPGSADGADDAATQPDLGLADCPDLEDPTDDERYIPPEIPPQPRLDPVARGAWTALFGGPGYLFIATTLGWQVPGWAELAAIIAFIAGFVILVSRLGDGPSRRDGPDQGAVV